MRITEERKASDKARWMESYNRLLEWHNEHHRLPKKRENSTLYYWYTSQRKSARIIHLDIDQKHLLQSIGVPLRQKRLSFEGCIERYKKDPSHDYCKKWRYRMIMRYREGSLSEYQIKKLRKVIDLDAEFNDNREKILRDSNERRHMEAFPKNLQLYMRYIDDEQRPFMQYRERKKANNWRTNMRAKYRKGSLPPEHIQILKKIKIIR